MGRRDILANRRLFDPHVLSQHARCLSLRISSARVPTLIPYELALHEGLFSPYWADLTCLSEHQALPLARFLECAAAIEIHGDAQESRSVCGIVTRAEMLGSDGGLTVYRLRIEAALALLAQRRNSRVFQNHSVDEIVRQVLDEHRRNNLALSQTLQFRTQLYRKYPPRSYCVQYRESDLAFIHRLLAEEGISYRFSHEPNEGNTPPQHTLYLFDHEFGVDPAPALAVSYERRGWDDGQHLDRWRCSASVTGNTVTLATYEYKSTSVRRADARGVLAQKDVDSQAAPNLQDFDPLALHAAPDHDSLWRYASLRTKVRDMEAQACVGEGAVVGWLPGQIFELVDEPVSRARGVEKEKGKFVAIRHFLRCRNNLPVEVASVVGKAAPATFPEWCGEFFPEAEEAPALEADRRYTARVTAVRQGVAIVARNAGLCAPRPVFGPQSAIVVGPHAGMVHTDELGRIRIVFQWQRPPNRPVAGPIFESPWSTWVRVATPNAGERFGTQFLPRVGDEVVVEFLDGDMSRPVVVGSVYNGRRPPPEFSGRGRLPGNSALSGIRTSEYGGAGGYNELLFDDTRGQLRARLATTDAESELNLGHLTQARADGQAASRGKGAELRTRGHASVRAGRGLLLTSCDPDGPRGEQLERQEGVRLMAEALDQLTSLGSYAEQHGAARCVAEPVQRLDDALRQWATPDAGGAPLIASIAQAGKIDVTPSSAVNYAGGSAHHAAREQIQLAAGRAVHVHAGASIDLFAQSEGLRAVAHRDDLCLQAQAGNLNADARQNITLRTQDGGIVLHGKTLRLVAADGSYIEIGDGITLGTHGSVRVRAPNFEQHDPDTAVPAAPAFTYGTADQRVVLYFPHRDHDPVDPSTWIVADHRRYTVTMADGSKVEGTTDSKGATQLLQRDAPQIAHIHVHEPEPPATEGDHG